MRQNPFNGFFDKIRKTPKAFYTSISAALFFSLAIILPRLKNSLYKVTGISDFSEHINAQASAHNIDVGARISGYYFYFLAALILFTIIGLFLFHFLKNKRVDGQGDKGFAFVKNVGFIGSASLLVTLMLNYSFVEFLLVIAVFAIPLVMGIFFIWLDKNTHRNFDMMIFSFALSLIVAVFFGSMLTMINLGETLFLLGVIAITGFSAFVFFILTQSKLIKNQDRVILAAIPFLFTGIAQSFCLEGLNIVNKRFNIVLNIQYIIYVGFILLSIVLFFTIRSKGTKSRKPLIYNLYLPMVLVTVGLIIGQPARMVSTGKEFFEYANHGLSINQLFTFGTIPLIESFDAHMLYAQVFGFLSGLLNGYEVWTETLYMGLYTPIYAVLVYALLNRIIGKTESFLFVLGFPILKMVFYEIYIIPVLMVIVIEKLLKHDKPWERTLVAIVSVVLCLYRLDIGFAAVVAGVLAYFLVNISRKEVKRIGTLTLTGVISVFVVGVLFFAICTLKDISPILRAKEFLIAAGSSQTWGYAHSGDKSLFVYNFVYYAMPISLMMVTIWFLYQYYVVNNKDNYSKSKIAMFLFFVFFYYINLSRGIIRHSLIENGNIWFITGTYFLAIMSLASVREKDAKRIQKFVVALLVSVMIFGVAYPSLNDEDADLYIINKTNHSLVSEATHSTQYLSQYEAQTPMNGTRVYGENVETVQKLVALTDLLLKDDQTYIDAASVNYFYALVGRQNPFYINQIPLMLNGDSGQRMALNESKSFDMPLALVPIKLDNPDGTYAAAIDGITLDYKFYKIYEYVFDHYVPLVRLGDIDVYCLPEYRDVYLAQMGDAYEVIDSRPEFWARNLGYLPILWGEKDGDDIYDHVASLSTPLSDVEAFMTEAIMPMDKAMNLVIEAQSTANTKMVITVIADGVPVSDFEFYLEAGTHRYVVRLSAEYYYWTADTIALKVEMPTPVRVDTFGLVDVDGDVYALDIKDDE